MTDPNIVNSLGSSHKKSIFAICCQRRHLNQRNGMVADKNSPIPNDSVDGMVYGQITFAICKIK